MAEIDYYKTDPDRDERARQCALVNAIDVYRAGAMGDLVAASAAIVLTAQEFYGFLTGSPKQ